MGNADRPSFMLSRLDGMRFTSSAAASPDLNGSQLSGTVGQITAQMLNFQGATVAAAQTDQEARALTLEALDARMSDEYGVDVDEEMTRLMELQNAFSANARVITVVQELLDALMRI